MSFDKAFAELQKLVRQIETEDIQVDTLATKVHEANELVKYCETRLRVIEEDVVKERE
jgi:exodeoxyribonuclease VII small subunit